MFAEVVGRRERSVAAAPKDVIVIAAEAQGAHGGPKFRAAIRKILQHIFKQGEHSSFVLAF